MKTKTIITELTQEDLVNLLCTATYGSNWLDCYANDREGVDITDEDCREDVWAKCLLAGKRITFVDYYAEGEHYGELPYTFGKEDEECEYSVSLQDIINGLQKCADGTFLVASSNYNNYGENERKFIAGCYNDLFNDGDNWDYTEADALMQIILFGELIYG